PVLPGVAAVDARQRGAYRVSAGVSPDSGGGLGLREAGLVRLVRDAARRAGVSRGRVRVSAGAGGGGGAGNRPAHAGARRAGPLYCGGHGDVDARRADGRKLRRDVRAVWRADAASGQGPRERLGATTALVPAVPDGSAVADVVARVPVLQPDHSVTGERFAQAENGRASRQDKVADEL